MSRVSLVLTALYLFLPAADAQEQSTIPPKVQKHMESMVGSWTFKGTTGDRKFTGQETIRLTSNDTALVQEGHIQWKDKKEHYAILSGWDGTKKAILVRAFTSDGVSWAGQWNTLRKGKWVGTASGGTATFEIKGDKMWYVDKSTGEPSWKAEYTRKKKKDDPKSSK